MSTIQAKLDAAARSIVNTASNAAESVKHNVRAMASGVGRVADVLVDAREQRKVAARVSNGIDKVYTQIGAGVSAANEAMETKGEATLAAKSALSRVNIAPVKVQGSSSKRAVTQVGNSLGKYHTLVAKQGEEFSRSMGLAAHALTTAILSPIRFVAKLLQVEVAGAILQNSVALAVGFAVRGITLAATQTLHALPYAMGVAALGAAGFGAFIGGKALVAAVGVTAAVIGALYAVDKLITGGVIFNLNKKIKRLAGQAVAPQAQPTRVQTAARIVTAPFRFAYEHKGKVAAAALAAGAAAGVYYYGVPAPVKGAFTQAAKYFGFGPQPHPEVVAASDATTIVSNLAAAGHRIGTQAFESVKAVLLRETNSSLPASYQVAQLVTAPAA